MTLILKCNQITTVRNTDKNSSIPSESESKIWIKLCSLLTFVLIWSNCPKFKKLIDNKSEEKEVEPGNLDPTVKSILPLAKIVDKEGPLLKDGLDKSRLRRETEEQKSIKKKSQASRSSINSKILSKRTSGNYSIILEKSNEMSSPSSLDLTGTHNQKQGLGIKLPQQINRQVKRSLFKTYNNNSENKEAPKLIDSASKGSSEDIKSPPKPRGSKRYLKTSTFDESRKRRKDEHSTKKVTHNPFLTYLSREEARREAQVKALSKEAIP